MNDGLTHFVGDTCEGGHRPTLVERLDHARIQLTLEFSYDSGIAGGCIGLLREAADRLERTETVVEAARTSFNCGGRSSTCEAVELCNALHALDDGGARSNEPREYHTTAGVPIEPATRSCPNAVSFCGGPDRYGDTCGTCLATWTEEAKGRNQHNYKQEETK